MELPGQQLMEAFLSDDHPVVAELLGRHPQFREHINRGVFDWNMPPLAAAKSREMVDVLIDNGAQVQKVTEWWAPGFGAYQVEQATALYLVQRGAELTIHAATAIGLIDIVREMLERSPEWVSAKGGDGCHPLHFCTDRDLAAVLLANGADIDARDEDHDSTPAQWRIGDAPDLVKFLLQRGATPDVFMGAGLGDADLTERLVTDDPSVTSHRIGNDKGLFPGCGFKGRGGSIYQWSLGFNLSPHEVALKRGHTKIYEFLMDRSAPEAKFLVACTSANRAVAESIAADHPEMVGTLDEEDLALLPKFCWETNKNIDAVRLMLDLGFPVDAREHNHGCTALHNAAWCGDLELVQLLIERGHPTDVRDPDYESTPIGWAVHSCTEAKRHPNGKFPEVVQLLLDNGTPFDAKYYPVGHEGIDAVIKQKLGL